MNIGVSSGCFYPNKTIDCLQIVADLGIKYTEIFFNTDSELDEEYVYKLKEIADRNNIKIVSVHPFTSVIETFMFFAKSDYKLADSIKYYEKYFRACRILGAEYVVIHGCLMTAEYMSMEKYAENLNLLQEKRREYGVYLSQENVVKFKCGYIENLKEFLKYAREDIKFTFDIKQTFRAGQDLYEILDLMGNRISHLHISDYADGKDSLIPGQGNVDFGKIFSIAGEQYSVEYSLIEVYTENLDNPRQIKQSVDWLEKFI